MKASLSARTRRGSVAVVLWLAVVAVGSGLVWSVISAAGEDFTRSSGAIPSAGGAVTEGSASGSPTTAVPAAPAPTSEATPVPPLVAPPTASPSAPPPSAVAGSTRAPRTSAPAPRPRSGSSASGGRRSTPPSSSAPRPPAAQTRTWSGAAGVVTTRCTGATIELAGASASADGYAVEVKDRGPEKVVVEFEGRGESTVAETKVEARCSAGVPTYRVESDD